MIHFSDQLFWVKFSESLTMLFYVGGLACSLFGLTRGITFLFSKPQHKD